MKKLADTLFLICAVYFVCMAVAHFFGLKYPVLFVYYDTPFYAYQDKIISFAVCAYVGLFFEAWRNVSVRPTAIIVLFLTVAGLSSVNVSSVLAEVLKDGQSTLPYWLQTGFIFILSVALTISHVMSRRSGGGD